MMIVLAGKPFPANDPSRVTGKTKLFWLAQGLRALSAGFALWLLLRIVRWWTDADSVIKAMGRYLGHDLSALPAGPHLLAMALGGWPGALCQGLTLLIRPLQTWLLTAHLQAAEQAFKWAFYLQHLLSAMLCGVLRCFAYLIAWAVDIAEEDRSFV